MRRSMRVPPGAEARGRTRAWYEENSPGQRRAVGPENISVEGVRIPIMEVRDFGEPQAICLQLDRELIAGSSGAYNASVRAGIEYGVGGAYDRIECDWNDGGLVTIVAQRLTVTAHGYAANPNQPYNIGDFAQSLICSVGKGQPSVIMPTYTEGIPTFGPGISASYRPPAFAKAVSVLLENETTLFADPYPDIQLVINHFGTFVPQGRIYGQYLGGGAAAPVPPDSQIVLRNTSAADSITGSLVWHLGL